ncbi:MAG TPA: hypothetical protein VN736_12590 [Candidatus Limnocylindrales bacterium]|nr:hypothetical protein [Candidatus Limnocylindrales bacterium]
MKTLPSIGGMQPIVLRAEVPETAGAGFLEAIFLPGRGMNLIKVRGRLPGLGEVDLLHSPPLEQVGEKLNGGPDDFMGVQSFSFGGAVRLIRLLERNGSNPEIFAALVHSCRYCGQMDASIAAHDRAFRLDRRFPTSVAHTYFSLGDYEKALYWYDTNTGMYLDVLALTMMGRLDEASALMWTRRERFSMQPALMYSLRCCLDGDATGGLSALREQEWVRAHDPEVRFYLGRRRPSSGMFRWLCGL